MHVSEPWLAMVVLEWCDRWPSSRKARWRRMLRAWKVLLQEMLAMLVQDLQDESLLKEDLMWRGY